MTGQTISPEEAFALVRAEIALPVCPPWCIDGEGHDYSPKSVFVDDADGYAISRMHNGSGMAHIYAFEVATLDGVRPLTFGISFVDPVEDITTADEARALASELVRASYQLEEITAS